MIPKTKVETPIVIEQKITIEPPFKRFLAAIVIVAAGLMISLLVALPPRAESESDQQLAREVNSVRSDSLTEVDMSETEAGERVPYDSGDYSFANSTPGTMALAEANKALIGRVYDEVLNNTNLDVTDACPVSYDRCVVLNETDFAAVDELFAPNFQDYQPGLPVFILGSKTVKFHVSVYRLAFPDLRYSVKEMAAQEGWVITHWQASGVHTVKFGLHDPTGERMSWTGVTVWRIADGQIVEARTNQEGPNFNQVTVEPDQQNEATIARPGGA